MTIPQPPKTKTTSAITGDNSARRRKRKEAKIGHQIIHQPNIDAMQYK